jgi:hypothetical protein
VHGPALGPTYGTNGTFTEVRESKRTSVLRALVATGARAMTLSSADGRYGVALAVPVAPPPLR